MQRATKRSCRNRIAAKINNCLRQYGKYYECVKKKLRIVRRKRSGKHIVHDANDVIRSGDIPSSLAVAVDESPDRFMRYESKPMSGFDTVDSIRMYRLDDMYEAVDY